VSRARFTTLRVRVGAKAYQVEARILPIRHAPHVGADSPRFMDPGAPARVQITRVLLDRLDVTGMLDEDLGRALREAVGRSAGIVSGPRGGERQALLVF
jgi:hypothetical protein